MMTNNDLAIGYGPKVDTARKMALKILADASIDDVPVVLNSVFNHLKPIYNIKVVGKELSNEMSGAHFAKNGKMVIVYNINHGRHRTRFTLAHELGHLLLGHTTEDQFYDLDRNEKFQEIEANEFARELLVPTKKIKESLGAGLKVDQLSSLFDVSPAVVSIQISKRC